MLPVYAKMKKSGIEWLGEVPDHWVIGKHAHYFRSAMGQTILKEDLIDTGEVPVFSATESGSIFGRIDCPTVVLGPGDIVIPARGVSIGYAILIRERSTCTQTTIYSKLVDHLRIISLYVRYFMLGYRSTLFYYDRTAIPQITVDQVNTNPLLVPSLPEQLSITSFLDHKTALIDDLIAKRERQIELLQEQRTTLITRTVTKGLNPDVPMMDSGVEAIGWIPIHWQISRLMHLTPPTRQIMYGIVLPGPNVEGGIPIVKSGDCKPEKLRLDRLNCTTPEIEVPYARARLEPGDIVYAIRGSIGASAMVPDELRGANLTQDAARIAPAKNVNPHWLWFAVQAGSTWTQLEAGIVGATVKGVNICDLKRPYIPVPPVEEQVVIAKYLMEKVASMSDLVEKTGKTIEKLKEYRQSLISAAVTGKIDVRNWHPSSELAEEILHA